MTADRLLRLYPRAWRERYGEEFLDLIGPSRLHARQVMDIAMGAIDAWLSADVRESTAHASVASGQGGGAMLATLKKAACVGNPYKITPRDVLISVTVLLGGTVLMSAAGIALGRSGYPVLGLAVKSLAFPISVTASMHFSYLRAQPARVQVAVTGTTLLILIWATYFATLI